MQHRMYKAAERKGCREEGRKARSACKVAGERRSFSTPPYWHRLFVTSSAVLLELSRRFQPWFSLPSRGTGLGRAQ